MPWQTMATEVGDRANRVASLQLRGEVNQKTQEGWYKSVTGAAYNPANTLLMVKKKAMRLNLKV
jgi:hypothetical protein